MLPFDLRLHALLLVDEVVDGGDEFLVCDFPILFEGSCLVTTNGDSRGRVLEPDRVGGLAHALSTRTVPASHALSDVSGVKLGDLPEVDFGLEVGADLDV